MMKEGDTPAPPQRRRLGATIPLYGVPLAAHREVIRTLVDLGYDDVWAGEANNLDAITPLAAAAAWAPELGIGTSVVPASTRGPALLAMTAAALAELAPGRTSFGVGSSSAVVVSDWNATVFDRPLARVRDTLRFMRDAFTGSSVTKAYDTFEVTNFRLGRPVESPPDLLVGALRPGMLEMAALEADGAITTAVAASDIPMIRRHLKGSSRLVAWVSVCPSTEGERVRQAARSTLASYLCVPTYQGLHRWLGREHLLAPMWDAWSQGRYREATAALPDSVIDELVVHGPPEACREGIARYFDAGVTDITISLDPMLVDPLEALRELAPQG